MLKGLRVFVQGDKQDIICPDHPTAPLEKGDTEGGQIFWKCSQCHNSAQWPDDAAREAELRELASKATSRR